MHLQLLPEKTNVSVKRPKSLLPDYCTILQEHEAFINVLADLLESLSFLPLSRSRHSLQGEPGTFVGGEPQDGLERLRYGRLQSAFRRRERIL
jgi:hypothetical protein